VTARDRTVLLVVAALALLAGFWFAALGPKRDEASSVTEQVTAAQERLDAARQTAASAQAARERYSSDYAAVARLGKAVPAQDDVPTLLYQLERAAHDNKIDFRSITAEEAQAAAAAPAPAPAPAASGGSDSGTATTTTATTAAATSAALAATLPPGAAIGPAGFPVMPFSFKFDGGFLRMQRFLRQLDRFTQVDDGRISVRGRLLTIDGIALQASRKGFPRVSATVSATAYLLPSEQGLTNGSTAQAPAAGGTGQGSATSSSNTTPATATNVAGSANR
jgi:hypothetical protein